MGGIVCAIRGGPDSQPTIARAIDLASETGLPLFFLYVVNLGFLSHSSSSRVHTISEQMRQMGEFILLVAQDRAARQGVGAQGIVRHGRVRDELIAVCLELEADYLVVGRSRVKQEDTVFSQELLREFIERTEAQTGAQVVLAEEDGP